MQWKGREGWAETKHSFWIMVLTYLTAAIKYEHGYIEEQQFYL